jgi:hypothetical protein
LMRIKTQTTQSTFGGKWNPKKPQIESFIHVIKLINC